MPASKTCVYKGHVPLEVKTFTDVYTPLFVPWDFDPHTFTPQQFTGWDNVANVGLGYEANIFDFDTGITNYLIGTRGANTRVDGYGVLEFKNNRLQGFLFPASIDRYANWADYSLTLGVNTTYPSIQITRVFDTGGGANTQSPDPRCFNNFPTVAGIYTSYEIALTQGYLQCTPVGGLIQSAPAFSLGFAPGNGLQNSMPWGAWNYAKQGTLIHQTDFVNSDFQFSPVFDNPPGDFDMNAWWAANNNNMNISYQGWIQFVSATHVIDGIIMNGFAVLIAGDFSYYRIIQIIPTDAESIGWNTAIGLVTGKFDKSGHLWFKKGNFSNFLFVSIGVAPVFKYLPIFPPAYLPSPPPDFELPLTLYRGTQK